MLKAVIFDFNGIIVDDEPIHLQMFQKVLTEEGISLTKEQYYDIYLGMDDQGCFEALYKANGKEISDDKLHNLINRKGIYYVDSIKENVIFFPGVVDFIKRASQNFRMAITSGALGSEIRLVLQQAELLSYFPVIISAEDVIEGKPDPEGFQKALYALNLKIPRSIPGIRAKECLVIEDSWAGIDAALGAGMKCLAVTNSYSQERLGKANRVISSLENFKLESLQEIFSSPGKDPS